MCLGTSFSGGDLRFCGQFGSASHRQPVCVASHAIGRAVIHLGRQRHAAEPIVDGERLNLIVWGRSSAFRAAAAFGHVLPDGYPKAAEAGEPDRRCLSESNDADYEAQLRRWHESAPAPVQPQQGPDTDTGLPTACPRHPQ